MQNNIVALVIFVSAYILFIFLPNKRAQAAILGSILLILLRVISPKEAFFSVNWNVMGIFVGTLIVAGIFMESRVPAYLAEIIVDRAKNTAWSILLICMLTGLISAFVDNVPFLVAMLPVAISMSVKLNIGPSLFLFGLFIGASLGGNITPIGASANIVACGLLKKEGHEVKFKDFMKIGIPFTFVAVAAACLFIWFIWGK